MNGLEKLQVVLRECLDQNISRADIVQVVAGKINPSLAGKKLMKLIREITNEK